MSAPTEGPWHWDAGDIGEEHSVRYCDVYTTDGQIVCSVNRGLEGWKFHARLLADAPALLAMVKTLQQKLCSDFCPRNAHGETSHFGPCTEARALLARIEG